MRVRHICDSFYVTEHAQPKKKVEKKYDRGEVVDEPLDDPVAEKLRRQR
jgi:hypothetical protein